MRNKILINLLILTGLSAYTAQAQEGWTKWTIPGYEYLCVEIENGISFNDVINYMNENNIDLAGAVHDFTNPSNGKNYMFFPIRKL